MRLKVSDLRVGTQYAIQVRANDGESVSEWGRRYLFVTARDDTQPKTPTNITWSVSGDSYMAMWDSVDEDVQNRPVSVIRYGVRVTSGATEHIMATSAASETESGRQRWDLLFQKAVNLFGKAGAKNIYFSVRAVIEGPDGPVHSAWSTPILASNTAPNAPTNGVAKPIIDGVELSWTESTSTDVVGYNVYVSTSGPDFVPSNLNKVGFVNADTYTYFTSTYELHYFKVRAIDTYDQESADLLIEGTPKSPFGADLVAPSAPTNFQGAMDNATSTINVTWDYTGPVDPEEEDLQGFAIRWKKPADTDWIWAPAVLDPAARSASISIPKAFAAYNLEIASFDKTANYSPWVGPITVTGGDGLAPAAPTVTVRADQTGLDFTITGTLAEDVENGGVWNYDISPNAGFTAPVYEYATGNKNLSVVGLAENTTYYYRVTVTDAEGLTSGLTSGSTSTTSFPTPEGETDGQPPAQVGTVTVTPGVDYLHASWPEVTTNAAAAPQTAPVVYEVHASTTTGFTPSVSTIVTQIGGTSTVIQRVGGSAVVAGTTYYIKVIAKDADGPGAASAQASGVPKSESESMVVTFDKVKTGTLGADILTIGAGGVLQSANYVAGTSGYKLDESGLTLYNGTVSASALKGGVITGTTVNIGAGGTLNVDSTAIIKSNNYAAGSTGWKLDSAGLEINNGSMSASLLSGGTINAGVINVSSTIQSSSGWWSITNSAINIYNGTISGATVETNQLYSTSTDPTTGRRLFTINNGGYAEFSGARIYGNTILGSGTSNYIQSNSYSPGSSGWKIDGSGNAYLNNATVYGTVGATGPSSSALLVPGSYGSRPGLNLYYNGYTTQIGQGTNGDLFISPGSGNGLIIVKGSSVDFQSISTITLNSGGSINGYINSGWTGSNTTVFGGPISVGGNLAMGNNNITNVNNLAVETINAAGNTITLSPNNGALTVGGGSNIRGKIYAAAGDSGIAMQGSRVVACGPNFDLASPTSATTRDMYALRFWAFTTTVGSASDRRIKKDIVPLENSIDTLKKLEIVSYRLKDDTHNTGIQYGIIAQDSIDVMDNLVLDWVPDEDDDLLAVNYQAVHMATTAAVQELIAKVETLEARINELESGA